MSENTAADQDLTSGETTAEHSGSVGSDVYLLKDSLGDDDEQATSDSLDGSDDIEPTETLNQRHRWQHLRNGVIVGFAAVVGMIVVAAVIVVVILSIMSLENPTDVDTSLEVTSSWSSPHKQATADIVWNNNCTTSIFGDVENGVRVFKGIRYALAPTGSLRWQPTVIMDPISIGSCLSSIVADKFGNKCAQLTDNHILTGSEDCLFLNIWSPDIDDNSASLDVIVYIHDGGFMTGSGHDTAYLPSTDLINEANAVFVSFNYRLNIFGFLAIEELTTRDHHNSSGYYGLLDQITALQWIKQHISAFGGNPDKVTVVGHGSGATSVYALLSSELSQNLLSRVWLSNPSPKFETLRQVSEQQNADFINKTGCQVNETSVVDKYDCLRGLSTTSLIHMLPWQTWLNDHLYGIPAVDERTTAVACVDGFVVKEPPISAWQKKPFRNIPVLIGSAAQASDIKLTPGHLTSWQVHDYITQRLMPFVNTMDINIDDVFQLYPVTESAEWAVTTLVSDMRVTCPLDEMARVAAHVSNSPVYRYQVTYHQTGEQLTDGMNYAYRGIDIDAFFNSAPPASRASDWSSLVANVRLIALQFVHSGHVSGWQRFPAASYNISTVISNATKPHFLSDHCNYWRTHGFFPEYAWVN